MGGIFGGVFFLLFSVLILLTIRWYLASERKSPDKMTGWLFTMREGKPRKPVQRWSPPPQA